jgi:subtilisin family serine protease
MKRPMERQYIQKAFHSYIESIPIAPFLYLNCKTTQLSNNRPTTVQQLSNHAQQWSDHYPYRIFKPMKTRLLAALLLAAGTAVAQPKISPRTQNFLQRFSQSTTPQPGYVYRTDAAGHVFMPAFLMMEPGSTGNDLEALGVHIGTRAGDVWTAAVPLSQLQAVAALTSVKYMELDEPLSPTMDSARRATRADSAQAGIALPKGFSGAGVVVGILDVGFDYTHPAFYDTTGTRYRIRRIWEQKATGGTPPSGYIFGREITDTTLMRTAGTDNNQQTHGTHVAGIAVGSGLGAGDTTNRKYRGMAYASDIVLVGITPAQSQWTTTGMSDIVDGMNYVFQYAASVGKPAVVNLSWGCPVGPHDGRSLFSQACNALTGPGKLFVLSAGNNGENALHLQKAFTAADTMLSSFYDLPQTPVGKRSWIDAWGDSSKTFSVRLSLYNFATRLDSSVWVSVGSAPQNVILRGGAGDSILVSVSTEIAPFNGKPHILLDVDSRSTNQLCISYKSTSGTVHAWAGYVYSSTGYYGGFINNGQSWATAGNNAYLVSDMVTTSSALAVGAYASKNATRNLANSTISYTSYVANGNLVPFSSRGPAVDGRIKPDITGPGLMVTAPVSSFDSSFMTGGGNRSRTITEWTQPSTGKSFRYGALQGTSMSSPAVSGITAMLLEAAPSLTPDSLRSLYTLTAIKDIRTGTIPVGGNASWGNGKVNAYGALQRIYKGLGVSDILTNSSSIDAVLYPNPSNGSLTLEYVGKKAGVARMVMTDFLSASTIGPISWNVQPGSNSYTIDCRRLPAGIYFLIVNTPDGELHMKATLR